MFDNIPQFNMLDIIALVLFCLCFLIGLRRGLFRMIFSFLSLLIAFFIARGLYLPVSSFLRENTGIYNALKERIIAALGLSDIIDRYIQQGEEVILSHLPLPQSLVDMLVENNIPTVRSALSALTLEDYIGSFLANIALNILSMIFVFILAMIIMQIIASALHLIVKLPLIRSFDKAGGALIGVLIGFVAVWLLVTISMFISHELVYFSLVGQFFLDYS